MGIRTYPKDEEKRNVMFPKNEEKQSVRNVLDILDHELELLWPLITKLNAHDLNLLLSSRGKIFSRFAKDRILYVVLLEYKRMISDKT